MSSLPLSLVSPPLNRGGGYLSSEEDDSVASPPPSPPHSENEIPSASELPQEHDTGAATTISNGYETDTDEAETAAITTPLNLEGALSSRARENELLASSSTSLPASSTQATDFFKDNFQTQAHLKISKAPVLEAMANRVITREQFVLFLKVNKEFFTHLDKAIKDKASTEELSMWNDFFRTQQFDDDIVAIENPEVRCPEALVYGLALLINGLSLMWNFIFQKQEDYQHLSTEPVETIEEQLQKSLDMNYKNIFNTLTLPQLYAHKAIHTIAWFHGAQVNAKRIQELFQHQLAYTDFGRPKNQRQLLKTLESEINNWFNSASEEAQKEYLTELHRAWDLAGATLGVQEFPSFKEKDA